jgi:hypothetical protein
MASDKRMVTRTWYRDGSTNRMGLDYAVANVRSNGDSRPSDELRAILLRGGRLATPRAEFRLTEFVDNDGGDR